MEAMKMIPTDQVDLELDLLQYLKSAIPWLSIQKEYKKLDLNTIKWKRFKPRYAENNITEFEFFWRTEDSNVRKQIHGDLVTLHKKEAYIGEIIKSIDKDLYFLKNITRIRIYEREKLLKSIEIDRKSLEIGVNLCKEVRTITINR